MKLKSGHSENNKNMHILPYYKYVLAKYSCYDVGY